MKNVIDLFAGCGGFSTGFMQAGFKIVKAVEFDKQIADSYAKNHIGTITIADDIKNVDNESFFAERDADIIIGGPPCQGFSMAGARIRTGHEFVNDPRNYLFKHYLNVVRLVKPEIYVFENVKGILTMNNGEIFREIIKEFSDADNFGGDKYSVAFKVAHAVEYGIPQKRERVIIFGTKNKSVDLDMLFEKTKDRIKKDLPTFFDSVSVWDAISNLVEPTLNGVVENSTPKSSFQRYLHSDKATIENHTKTNHSSKAIERMSKIGCGENFTALNETIKSIHSGSYGRLEKDGIAPTIVTRFDTPSGGKFTHPTENRTLTPREAARIQSFPDDFVFYGNKTSVCKQIGNAVPPKLAYFIANVIKEFYYENN